MNRCDISRWSSPRFTRVSEVELTLPDTFAASAGIDKLTLAVEAQSSQRFRGRTVAQQTEEILRFYSSLIGDVPYKSATVALIESDLPGGHSPGYFALIKNPLSTVERRVAQRSRRRSTTSPNSSWPTSSRTSGGGRRSGGRTTTSSG